MVIVTVIITIMIIIMIMMMMMMMMIIIIIVVVIIITTPTHVTVGRAEALIAPCGLVGWSTHPSRYTGRYTRPSLTNRPFTYPAAGWSTSSGSPARWPGR
jgi:hypothetical protein